MRKGFMGNMVLRTESGETLGVAAGSDATSEHLQGIGRLQTRFGCDAGALADISRRVLRNVPPEFGVEPLEDGSLLLSSDLKAARYFMKSELFFSRNESLAGAWDSNNFAFRARNEAVAPLLEIAQAIPQQRVMFGTFLLRYSLEPGGVILALKERVPTRYLEEEQERVDAAKHRQNVKAA